MQTQTITEVETIWREKSLLEQEYEAIMANNRDRSSIVEEMMQTVVTDTLRKTAKSYNKK